MLSVTGTPSPTASPSRHSCCRSGKTASKGRRTGRGQQFLHRLAHRLPRLDDPTALQSRQHRQVLEDIVFKFRTGLPWRDLPARSGPWQTVHGRFARWAADLTFDRLLAAAGGSPGQSWTGWSPATPRSCGPTSTPPHKRARKTGSRTHRPTRGKRTPP
ncbi:transposase [Streptomyces sp. NPDC055299]